MGFACFWHLIFIQGQCSQPSSLMEFAWFHSEFIQGSCQGNLIYHGICMLLASNLYSGSVLQTSSPMEFAWFHSEFIQGSCHKNLICHRICMLLALNQSLFKVNHHSQCSSPSLSPSPHPPRAAVANDHHHHHHTTTTTTTTTTTIPFSPGPSILGTLFARNASFFIQ